MTPRETIGSHYTNERDNLYRFARRSDPPLPRGYFDKGPSADFWVLVVCAVCLIVGLAVSL